MKRQPGLFDMDERLRRLSDIGDQFEAFAAVADFEMFRPELEAALGYGDGVKGGRPPFDPVMMFKILVIQACNGLSDDRAEFLINDRLSFMRFLGLGLTDKVPDAKTIWAFRERLTQAGAIEALFARFDHAIREAGYIPMAGQIVDASLVSAPRQRNTEAEKVEIKAGRVPPAWRDKPAKLRQKDRDARWTLVFGKARLRADGTKHADIAIPVFGYKSHAGIDRRHGFIRKWDVTDASRHDGTHAAPGSARRDQHRRDGLGRQRLPIEGERSVHGEARLPQPGPPPQAEGSADGAPYPPRQRQPLQGPRRRRACLRPAEGADGLFIRTIGIARARVKIGMANLAYNIGRLVWQERRRGLA